MHRPVLEAVSEAALKLVGLLGAGLQAESIGSIAGPRSPREGASGPAGVSVHATRGFFQENKCKGGNQDPVPGVLQLLRIAADAAVLLQILQIARGRSASSLAYDID